MDIQNTLELSHWQPPSIDNLISGNILLPESRMIIYGKDKSWKSMISMHTAFVLASGTHWFGFPTKKCRVLVIQSEIAKAAYQKRFLKYIKGNSLDPHLLTNLLFATEFGFKLDKPSSIATLQKAIYEKQPDVIILDPLYKMISGIINDTTDVSKVLDTMDGLMGQYHCSFIIVAHRRKQQTVSGQVIDSGSDEIVGNKYFANWCDSAVRVSLQKDNQTDVELKLDFTTMRHDEVGLKPLDIKAYRTNLTFKVTIPLSEKQDLLSGGAMITQHTYEEAKQILDHLEEQALI